jgi:uncharacterized protein (TIGR03435 family)
MDSFLDLQVRDQFFVVVAKPQRVVLEADFTTGVSRVRGLIDSAPPPRNVPALDAVYLGLEKIKTASSSRKALLLLVDGEDSSRYTIDNVRAFARQQDVRIFVVGAGLSAAAQSGFEALAADSRGKAFFSNSFVDLKETLAKVAAELGTAQYLLGYRSTNAERDGSWRPIRVRVNRPVTNGPIEVRFRSGYYAPAPQPQKEAASIPQTFEVASVKPENPNTAGDAVGCRGRDGTYHPAGLVRGVPPLGRCQLPGITLRGLINAAYNLFPNSSGLLIKDRILGGPSWADADHYHVEGKADEPETVTQGQLQEMLKALLADRFKLRIHREVRQVSGYTLVVSDRGPKLTEVQPDAREENSPTNVPVFGPNIEFTSSNGDRSIKGQRASVGKDLVRVLAVSLGSPVLDKTGLNEVYDFTLRWAPAIDEARIGRSVPSPLATGSSIFTALTEQLGLRLVAQKVPVEVLVIDQAEKPSTN